MPDVRSSDGLPVVSDFTSGKGTPLVVNQNNGRGYVLTESNVIVPISSDEIDIRDYDVDLTGVNDSTSGVLLALSELATNGGTLKVPVGTLSVSSVLILQNAIGVIIQGAGKGRTLIVPSTALAGLTVLSLRDVRDSSIRDLWIQGNASGAPDAAIESRNIAGNIVTPTHNEFRNLTLGSDVSSAMVKGIKFTGAVDANNDGHCILNASIRNMTGACVSIEHSQSQLHNFYNLSLEASDVGFDCAAGGNFNLFGGQMNCTTTDFKWGTGTHYGHATTINNVCIEDGAQLIDAAVASDGIIIKMNHVDKGAVPAVPSGSVDIDFQSANGIFSATHCHLFLGNPVKASFSDSGQIINWHNNTDAFDEITFAGEVHMSGNTHLAGSLTMTPSGAGSAFIAGDTGGGFTKNQIRVVGDYLTIEGGSGTLIDSAATKDIQIRAGGATTWLFQNTAAGGNLFAQNDGVPNIGDTASNRPGSVYVRDKVVCPHYILDEVTDPSAVANQGNLYVKDNGAGKSQLCVRFGSGAVQVIATEP